MDAKFLIQTKSLNLVVFTKYFGYNFTGATITTHELINEWKKYFKNITIITKNIGDYDIKDINIVRCKTFKEMANKANDFNKNKDRKSTRLNSSHANISYAVFCLKKKKKNNTD